MAGDDETVIPSLPEPGVWTGMAQANVLAPLRWEARENPSGLAATKYRAASEAGYTSAVVTIEPDPVDLLQSGGVRHLADIRSCIAMSAFGGKADIAFCAANVCF